MMQYITDYFSSIFKKNKPVIKSTEKTKTLTTEPATEKTPSSPSGKIVDEPKASATVECGKKPISRTALLVTGSTDKKAVTSGNSTAANQKTPILSSDLKPANQRNQYHISNRNNQMLNNKINKNTIVFDDTKYEVMIEESVILMRCINEGIRGCVPNASNKQESAVLNDKKNTFSTDKQLRADSHKPPIIKNNESLNKDTKKIKNVSFIFDEDSPNVNGKKNILLSNKQVRIESKKTLNKQETGILVDKKKTSPTNKQVNIDSHKLSIIQNNENLKKDTKRTKRVSFNKNADLSNMNNRKTIINNNSLVTPKSSKSSKSVNINDHPKQNTSITKNLKNTSSKPVTKKNFLKKRKPLVFSKTPGTTISRAVGSKKTKTNVGFFTKSNIKNKKNLKEIRQVSSAGESSSEDISNLDNYGFNNENSLSISEVIINSMSDEEEILVPRRRRRKEGDNETRVSTQKQSRITPEVKNNEKGVEIKLEKRSNKSFSAKKKLEKSEDKKHRIKEKISNQIYSEGVKKVSCDSSIFVKQETTHSKKITDYENLFDSEYNSSVSGLPDYNTPANMKKRVAHHAQTADKNYQNDKTFESYKNNMNCKYEAPNEHHDLYTHPTAHKNTDTKEHCFDNVNQHSYNSHSYDKNFKTQKPTFNHEKIPVYNHPSATAGTKNTSEYKSTYMAEPVDVNIVSDTVTAVQDMPDIVDTNKNREYKSQSVDNDTTSYHKTTSFNNTATYYNKTHKNDNIELSGLNAHKSLDSDSESSSDTNTSNIDSEISSSTKQTEIKDLLNKIELPNLDECCELRISEIDFKDVVEINQPEKTQGPSIFGVNSYTTSISNNYSLNPEYYWQHKNTESVSKYEVYGSSNENNNKYTHKVNNRNTKTKPDLYKAAIDYMINKTRSYEEEATQVAGGLSVTSEVIQINEHKQPSNNIVQHITATQPDPNLHLKDIPNQTLSPHHGPVSKTETLPPLDHRTDHTTISPQDPIVQNNSHVTSAIIPEITKDDSLTPLGNFIIPEWAKSISKTTRLNQDLSMLEEYFRTTPQNSSPDTLLLDINIEKDVDINVAIGNMFPSSPYSQHDSPNKITRVRETNLYSTSNIEPGGSAMQDKPKNK
ncbi:hypothetical protein CDIK_0691 [Cucumispora dikerogammari]|nr:hypothetical protein CDIK_0691 [Cucumispora dikerogammari]